MGRGINYSVGRNRENNEKEKVRLRRFSEQINLLLRKYFNLWFLDTIDVALQILLSNYCLAVQGINAPLVLLVIRVAAAFCLFIHTHNYIYIYLHNCSLICFCGGWSSYPSKNDLTKKYLDTTCSRDLWKKSCFPALVTYCCFWATCIFPLDIRCLKIQGRSGIVDLLEKKNTNLNLREISVIRDRLIL